MTIPTHRSHCMQSLDVSCFKPFKQYLQEEKAHLTMTNPSWGNNCILKSTLAQMVLQALQKALKPATIMSGFRAIELFPLDSTTMDKFYGPSIHHLQISLKVICKKRFWKERMKMWHQIHMCFNIWWLIVLVSLLL
jgi:hypothetical protein